MQALRNVAIIAHVDHGKTSLVDKILYQCSLFADHQEKKELILDNNDLERERGITILAKNVSVNYKNTKINIIDTPGHADFGGEVERVLNMADAALLVVDAFEGPMPQTRYVLGKALELGLKPILVVNKVDKPNCRPDEVVDDVFDLMVTLDATDEQLDFPVVFGSAKHGWMAEEWENPTSDVSYLLDVVLDKAPTPKVVEGETQVQVTNLEYSRWLGRVAIGRVSRGTIRVNDEVTLLKRDGSTAKARIKELSVFEGLGKANVDEVHCGDIGAISGLEGFDIGDTIAGGENPEALPTIPIDEPALSMLFTINDSPFFGKEGEYVTSRHLRDRLYKETEKNLALKVEETDSADSFLVYGRGVLHLSVLIETMRREGYEFAIGQPQVIIREIEGKRHEPMEELVIDSPEHCAGKIIEAVTQRKGELTAMEPKADRQRLSFNIPARGIIGLRTPILNLSAGEALIAHRFQGYEPWKGELPTRLAGVMIAHDTGTVIPYAVDKLQDRGHFFVGTGEDVYGGQVIGEHVRQNDLEVNVIRTKKLSNMRASGSDEKMRIAPPVRFSLEECMEYIQHDEYVEITPKSIRMRKILLNETDRKRASKQMAAAN
ncbi:MAG: translational GTPase TypA [Bacteroidia bacterium]